MWLVSLLWLSLSLVMKIMAEDPEVMVWTKDGQVLGKRVEAPLGSVTAFLGIPYGEAPVGERRFKKPEPRQPWKGLLQATQFPNSCYQFEDTEFPGFWGTEMWNANTPMSEDCLFLNIWVPSPQPQNATVMVWIFGGGFAYGTSSLNVYDGRYLAQAEGVIVVSMNYRVGALGFLSLPGGPVPGNAGLFDQQLALRWVHGNIHRFGGNPQSVTLFGESAGGASVASHLLSRHSQQFFQRAILQSGVLNAPWATVEDAEARRRAEALAQALGCTTDSDNELLHCLYAKPPQEIVNKEGDVVIEPSIFRFPFVPVVDGHFIIDSPTVLLQQGIFKKTDLLLGVNRNEGSFFLIYGAPGFSKDHESLISREDFLENIPMIVPQGNEVSLDAIVLQYTDWLAQNDAMKNRDAIEDMVGDYNVICPVVEMAARYAEFGNNVYFYFFDQRASNLPWPQWMGVLHGYEIEFVFGLPLNRSLRYTSEERAFSRELMHSWAMFAKTGKPGSRGKHELWPLYSREHPHIRNLSTSASQLLQGHRTQQCVFWNDFMPKLVKSTATLDEEERQWKEEFHRWNDYMVDWKQHFEIFSSKRAECSGL
uniref:Carboxylic ester hydrolase n=1 Tax=Eptatretus burgeri TaxID=7764 RepID=A0A8C4QT41_EPTBU